MSADNWAYCPVCIRDRDVLIARKQAAFSASYGTVSADAYLRGSRDVADEIARMVRNSEPTFREDYEIGIDEDTFTIDYYGKCTTCGFTHVAKDSVKLKLPPLSGDAR